MLERMLESACRPGNIRADEPVDSMTFFALIDFNSPPSSATVWRPSFAGPVSLPHPRTTSTLFFFIRNCRPLACLSTMPCLRFWIAPQFSETPAVFSSPSSMPSFTWSKTSALNSKALVGMQPTCRQVPPRNGSFSMRAAFSPSCPARMAAVYPAGPLPMMATS